jgi:peroxiredoxin
MVVRPGDTAPEFRLPAIGGEVRSLSEATARGRHVLLVFLRHLG